MSSESQSETTRFYYADGKKVFLEPSRHYVAVQSTEGATESGPAILSQSLPPTISPAQVMHLPEYNLIVVEVSPAAVLSGDADAVRAMADAQPGLSAGPTVYEPAATSAQEGLIDVGEIVVKFKEGASASARRALLERSGVEVRQSDYPEPGAYLLAVKQGQDAIEAANRLHESDLVAYAQPNFLRLMPRLALVRELSEAPGAAAAPAVSPAPAATVTDPNISSQWGLVKIKASEAWDISMGSPAITIAIIDEGCNLAHEDLAYKLPGYDAVTRTDNQEPQPGDGHGTACAGIAAAKANNGKGGAGVAPGCLIMPVRIARGVRSGWYTTDAMIADGIRTAVNRGADVLSNSWGGGAPSSAITSAFQYAQTSGRGGKGCAIAIATGNGDVRGVSYPANLSPTIPGLLAVGASNQWDQRKSRTSLDGENWWGSNYGPEVDVVAPGVKIFTTDITGSAGYGSGNYVPNFNGTSSATPHVGGLMGLILSVDPDLRSWEVEEIIKSTTDELGAAGRDEEFGFGRINARRALEATSRIWFEVRATPEFIGAGRECFMRMQVRIYNPGINTVRLNGLAVLSHNDDWTAEIDRFEYQPNPGGIMAPRSGHDIRLSNILLKANGTASGWSYRWSMSWGYTFWRPSSAALPLGAGQPLAEADGRSAQVGPFKGAGSSDTRIDRTPRLDGRGTPQEPVFVETPGDMVTVDRQKRTITIVIQ
ncbi:MAG: hypothetical protein RLZZ387_102 [Chloroflexota bacterium]|jgi:subtilisin family serine protease